MDGIYLAVDRHHWRAVGDHNGSSSFQILDPLSNHWFPDKDSAPWISMRDYTNEACNLNFAFFFVSSLVGIETTTYYTGMEFSPFVTFEIKRFATYKHI